MIIDCHGHYTTAPGELQVFRDAQLAASRDPALAPWSDAPRISDDQIRDSLEKAQLKLQRERGSDLTIFSPRASAMGHHLGNEAASLQLGARMQRPDLPRLPAVSATTSSACASCRSHPASRRPTAPRSWSAACASWASSAAT